jgi:hypothetical protein
MSEEIRNSKEIVYINVDLYDSIYSQWVIKLFGKAMDDSKLMHRFDKSLGLQLTNEEYELIDMDNYSFEIIDKKKFMIAKIKYGF